jgi:hypothetical protein
MCMASFGQQLQLQLRAPHISMDTPVPLPGLSVDRNNTHKQYPPSHVFDCSVPIQLSIQQVPVVKGPCIQHPPTSVL